jgi:hypothetical protein
MIILNFFLEDMADPTRLNHAPKRSCLPCKVGCQRHLGECYGFFPALEIGGVSLVENTRKVKALGLFQWTTTVCQGTRRWLTKDFMRSQ